MNENPVDLRRPGSWISADVVVLRWCSKISKYPTQVEKEKYARTRPASAMARVSVKSTEKTC